MSGKIGVIISNSIWPLATSILIVKAIMEVDKFLDLEEQLKSRGYSGIWKEVDKFLDLEEQLKSRGYSGIWKHNDSSNNLQIRFKLLHEEYIEFNKHELRDNVAQICVLEVRRLLEGAHAVSKSWDNAPVVLCGDFNCTPKSPLYNFISEQKLDLSEVDRDKVSGQAYAEIPLLKPYYPNSGAQFGDISV
ncbi:hypothetical protein REPUB_Repub03eG0116400 [Reevesia pubescens]